MNFNKIVACLLLAIFVGCNAFSDLKNAFDAAHMRLLANGTFQAVSANDPYAIQVSDCFATPEYYPYPPQPTGALKTILARRIVFVGSIEDGTLYFNTSNRLQPGGWGIALVNGIFRLMSANYGVPLTLQWKYFDTSYDVLASLQNGTVDLVLPNFSLGAFWNGTRRSDTFEPTCSISGSQTNIFVKTNGNFQTLAQLKAKGAQLKLATSGAGSAFSAQALFPLANITDFATFTAAELTNTIIFEAVRTGQYDLSFDVDPTSASDVAGLTRIDSGVITTVGGFFRRDASTTPSPSTCGPTSPTPGSGNTININFAGILSTK